jgi:hypothetical protein
METHADALRRLANMLDEDFDKNVLQVGNELNDLLKNIVNIIISKDPLASRILEMMK